MQQKQNQKHYIPEGSQPEQYSEQPFRWNRFEQRHKQKKQQQKMHEKDPNTIELPIGTVKKVNFKQDIPEGWRKLRMQQGRKYFQELKSLLTNWSIVAFQVGALDGPGYGYNFKQKYDDECGEGFIILQNNKTESETKKQ